MTLVAVPIFVAAAAEVPDALARAARAGERGADLVEWRIDELVEEPDGLEAAQRLVRESTMPCIVTARSAAEGGRFDGDDRDRLAFLERLAATDDRPGFLDVELSTVERSANARQKVLLAVDHPEQPRPLATRLILSAHDFEGRPPDLMKRVARMQADPACAVTKVAWRARSLRDNLEAFDLLRERGKPMIALCMGEFGLMSRVLAPKFGGFLTFAVDDPQAASAPGQPSLDDLVRLGFRTIGPETRVLGVVGWPVGHSRSPEVHNHAFALAGRDAVHLPLPVPPEWEHFKATVTALVEHPALDFVGASVTIPHKSHLVRLARERGWSIPPLVERIGAANTLAIRDDGAEISNTDAPALAAALADGMGLADASLESRRVAVLGTGGAARAAAVGLADAGASVVLFSRDDARAAALAEALRPHAPTGRIVAGRAEQMGCGCFHAFVNCTPVGMAGGPAPDESPLPDDVPLDDTTTVMDTVYAPARTPLLAEAESRGARVVGGIEMFLRQAALQHRAWFGEDPPRGAYRA